MPGSIDLMPKAGPVPYRCLPPDSTWKLVAESTSYCWYEAPREEEAGESAWQVPGGVASCRAQGTGSLYCEIRKSTGPLQMAVEVWHVFKPRVPGEVVPGCSRQQGLIFCPGGTQVLGGPQPGPLAGSVTGGAGSGGTTGSGGAGGSGEPGGGNGSPGRPGGISDICRKSPQSYTCLYGHAGVGRGDSGGGPPGGSGGRGNGKGLVRTGCGEAAAKGIYRPGCQDTPPPDERASSPATTINLALEMDLCFSASGMTYYRTPALARGGTSVEYDPSGAGTILYDSAFLDGESPYDRAFWLADAYATHVLDLERRVFGVERSPGEFQRARDYLAGYALKCAYSEVSGLGGDPRVPLEKYLEGSDHFSYTYEPSRGIWELEDWGRGWRDGSPLGKPGVIFSLRHDPSQPPTSSDPYRWPG